MVSSFEPNLQNKAIEKAYAACSFLEQLDLLQRDLTDLSSQLPLEYRANCELVKSRVASLIAALDDGSVELPSSSLRKLRDVGRSKVEKLKLGAEIVKLRRQELSYKEIGERLDLSASSVSQFCRAYDELSPVEKTRVERASIFDTVSQLEDIGAIIYRQLARLEYSDSENHVKYISELRQVIKQANDVASAISQQRQREELKAAIVAVLAELAPDKVEVFLSRVRSIGAGVQLPVAKASLPTTTIDI